MGRDISAPLIAIEALAASSPFGDLEEIWQSWLGGARRPAAPRGPEDWRRRSDDALKQVLHGVAPEQRRATGLILASTKGDIGRQGQWMRAADEAPLGMARGRPAAGCGENEGKVGAGGVDVACPTLGSEAARLALQAMVAGPAWAISTACSSGLVALIDAALALLNGEAPGFVVLAADDGGDFVKDGFAALQAISRSACRPFDRRRDGLTLGAAAAAALLTPRLTRSSLAIISGWGLANDATHMTAPDRTASGLSRAIRQALAMASLYPEDIDVMLAHGTGTRYNDAMEARAIEAVFDIPRRKGPAVTAVKGLIGHTLGASGLLESALAVNMLRHQSVPAITGLEQPEYPEIDLVAQPRRTPIRHLLKTASGFGGLNAAVVLSAPDPALVRK